MRDVQPIVHRVPEYEPPTELPGGPLPDRCRARDRPAGPPSPRISPPGAQDPATPPAPTERESAVAAPASVPAAAISVAVAAPATRVPGRTTEVTAAHCRPRVSRGSLRSGSSAPASIRRIQRAAHTAERSDEHLDAREFAGRTLQILLETLDHRRPVAQLTKLCAPALVHAVGSLVAGGHVPSRTLGTAVLVKYQLFPVADRAFELVAMYDRGPRRLALAGRVEHTKTGWKVTALRLA